VIEKEKFNHVRIAALDSLGQIGGPQIAGIVEGLVRDDDQDVAHAAQVALGKNSASRAKAQSGTLETR
jgi:HEAT repeat protein